MATPTEPAAGVSDLDQFLAVPKSDKELEEELERLGKLIQHHVEDPDYYITRKRNLTPPLNMYLWDLGLRNTDNTLPSFSKLQAMALDPNMRSTALQHVIARVIFGSLSVKPVGKISLLPPLVSSLMRDMPPCEKDTGNPEGISWDTFTLETQAQVS